MKYKAVIETDEYKDFEFFEDGNGKYIHGIDAGAVNNEWILLYFTECKQEPILDKIRADVELQRKEVSNKNSENDELQAYYHGLNDGLKDARDIIDKYKKESEDKYGSYL